MEATDNHPAADPRTPLQQLADNVVWPMIATQPEDVRRQVEQAFAAPPASSAEVDAWFVAHFHAAPVSHDTALFNQLQGIKASVREAAGGSAG